MTFTFLIVYLSYHIITNRVISKAHILSCIHESDMKAIIGIIIASLLAVTVVAVAVPNTVQAQPHKPSFYCVEGTTNCAGTLSQCKDLLTEGLKCIKIKGP
jgi:Mn2+/Fe2+ NRAMP family transporter